jgi:hypothetical protein
MDRETRKAAIAALVILFGFGAFTYFLPTLMLAAGKVSQFLAAAIVVVFLLVLFVVFWLRSRAQRKG